MITNKKLSPTMVKILTSWQAHAKSCTEGQILTYLSKIFFNIHRLPIAEFQDRNLININKDILLNFFQENSFDFSSENFENRLQSLLEDFENMYQNTQQRLKDKFENDEYIELSRRIIKKFDIDNGDKFNCENPCKLYSYIYNQKKDNKDCEIYMDILNDWADYSSPIYGVIILKKKIPIKDIIYFNHYNDCTGPLEEDDYIVVNRSLTGGVVFSCNDIQCDDEFLQDFLKLTPEKISRLGTNKLYNIFDGRVIYSNNKDKSTGLFRELYYTYKYHKKYKK